MTPKKLSLKTYLIVLIFLMIIISIGYFLIPKYNINNPLSYVSTFYIALFYMPMPFYALLISSKIQKIPLNLSQYGSIKNLKINGIISTILLYISWVLLCLFLTILASNYFPDEINSIAMSESQIRSNMAQIYDEEIASQGNLPQNASAIIMIPLIIISSIISGCSINLIFAMGEEYGWRGFLRSKFTNFYSRIFIIGTIWGLWHAPIIFDGHNYGRENGLIGIIIMTIFTICISFALEVLFLKHENVIYAGILHGTFNGSAGLFLILFGKYNPIIFGPAGLISCITFVIIGFMMLFIYKIIDKKWNLKN